MAMKTSKKNNNVKFALSLIAAAGISTAAFYAMFISTPMSEKYTPLEHMKSQFEILDDFANWHGADSKEFADLSNNQANHFNKKLSEDFAFKVEAGKNLTFSANFLLPEAYTCNGADWFKGFISDMSSKNTVITATLSNGDKVSAINASEESVALFTKQICTDGKTNNAKELGVTRTYNQVHSDK